MMIAKPKRDFTVVYVDSPNTFNETFATFRCSFLEDPALETGMSAGFFDLPPYVLDPFIKNPIIKVYKLPEWERDEVTKLWYNRKIFMDNGNFFELKSETENKTLSYELYIMEETGDAQKNIFMHTPAEYHEMNHDNLFFHDATIKEVKNRSFLSEGHGIEYIKYEHSLNDYIGVSYGASSLAGIPLSIIYKSDLGVKMLDFAYLSDEFQGQVDLLIQAFEEDFILLQNIHNQKLFTMKIANLEWENKQI